MAADATIHLTMPEPDIALLAIDVPGSVANLLSERVMDELAAHLGALERRRDLAGLIVASGKPGTFVEGLDLVEFAGLVETRRAWYVERCGYGRSLFRRLAACPLVSVAAIDGACLGVGMELSSWCDRRILSNSPATRIGLAQMPLGPVLLRGGTARIPRLIGLSHALQLIANGRTIDANAALAMGWATEVVPRQNLLQAAAQRIRQDRATGGHLRDRRDWSGPAAGRQAQRSPGQTSAEREPAAAGANAAARAISQLMEQTSGMDAEAACQREAQAAERLLASAASLAQLNVFFLTQRNTQDTGIDRGQIPVREIRSAGVIGAGIMGRGIAVANLRRGIRVAITDAAPDVLARCGGLILAEASQDGPAAGPRAPCPTQAALPLRVTAEETEIADCDLVIESVVETAEVKRKILARLEPRLRADAILASNTSTIRITQLARDLQRPERFCGIHFFNPVAQRKLVEIVRGQKTSDATVANAVAYAKDLDKMPIVVNDAPGFLVNRLLFPYLNEALELLREGAQLEEVERAAAAFGMAMGPLELCDTIGLDTAFYAGLIMWDAFRERIVASPMLPVLLKAGRLGRKSGAGFFSYPDAHGPPQPDPCVRDLLAPYVRRRRSFSAQEITSRLFLPMLLEASRVLEEAIVRDPRDIDLAVIFGLGFPAAQGGLLFWADRLGAEQILAMANSLEHLGPRARPTQLLLDMAQRGGRFYRPW